MTRQEWARGVLVFISFFLLGSASCTQIPLDRNVSAAEANDPSVILTGCATGTKSGYIFCRVREGAPVIDPVTFIVPDVKCSRDSCVKWQMLRKDGSPGIAGSFKKGQTDETISIGNIVGGTDHATSAIDGEYSLLIKVFFDDAMGAEHIIDAKGFIRINVIAKDYSPLSCNDPDVAWTVDVSKTCAVQYSSKLRSAVCGC